MNKVLVTGGNGFIGRYVAEELQDRGYGVAILDRHQKVGVALDYEEYFGDIKNATLVTDAIAHVDGVIHLAGVLGTQETISNPVPAAETNILGGLNVINACVQYDVPLVNIAVGNWWMDNTYSITKNTVERFVEMKRRYEGRAMMSVRGLNAYGPRQVPIAPWGSSRVRKILPSFICRGLSKLPIEVYGDGSQIMDMIYVEDLARILVKALEFLVGGNIVPWVEAGTGRETSVKDIANLVAGGIRVRTDEVVKIEYLPMRPGEDEHSRVLAKADSLLHIGVDPASLMPLENGVMKTIDYFIEYLSSR